MKPEQVSAARQRLAQVETVEDATDLVDELERLREYGRLIDAAPGQINEITLVKVETRAKRADLVDAGQEAGRFRKRGRPSKKPHAAGALPIPVPDQRLDEDRVLRDGLDHIRKLIAAAEAEVIDRQLLDLARRRRAQETDRSTCRQISRDLNERVAVCAGCGRYVLEDDPCPYCGEWPGSWTAST
jgi:hypothetical protein